MKSCSTLLAIIGTLFAVTLESHAQLILNLTGTAGSNVISYAASGSVTVTQSHTELTSAHAQAPSVGGGWNRNFDNDLGDFIRDPALATNIDLVLSNGGVSYRKNGVEFGILDTIDLNGGSGGGLDDIQLDPTASLTYPSLIAGDIISWVGSGTFVLLDNETFDSFFTATGTFSNSIDGGIYSATIAAAAVPEPAMAATILGVVAVGVIGVRRRPRKDTKTGKVGKSCCS